MATAVIVRNNSKLRCCIFFLHTDTSELNKLQMRYCTFLSKHGEEERKLKGTDPLGNVPTPTVMKSYDIGEHHALPSESLPKENIPDYRCEGLGVFWGVDVRPLRLSR
ncbi:hypothetical protein TWF730_007441 [Orbilia blumenaviensis]|uniref:Uncharacterized protein n=1 Tax=Orbilia blumenaviensis TaxID=1796055 RepID=A0AAV9VB22_9PEZI